MANTNEYSERRHLFSADSNDIRGNLWSKAAFTQAFGPLDASGATEGRLLEDIMFARDYVNKEEGMFDNDVHWEVVDMVVKAAFTHKLLDKPTTTGTLLEEVRNYFDELSKNPALANAVKNQLTDVLKDGLSGKLLNDSKTFEAIIGRPGEGDSGKFLGDIILTDDNVRNLVKHFADKAKKLELVGVINTKLYEILRTFTQKITANALGEIMTTLRTERPVEIAAPFDASVINDSVDRKLDEMFESPGRWWLTQSGELADMLNGAFKGAVQPAFSGQYTTVGSNPVAQNFFKNVVGNWHKMDERTKSFYKRFIDVIDLKSGQPIVDLNTIDVNNTTNYRINLKKFRTGSELTVFGESLPLLPIEHINAIWYTDASGKHVKVNVANWKDEHDAKYFLRALYHHVYSGGEKRYILGEEPEARSSLRTPSESLTGGSMRNMRSRMQRGGSHEDVPAFEFLGVTFNIPRNYQEALRVLSATHFSLNVDKLVRRRLYAVVKAKPASSDADTTDGTESKTYDYMDIDYNVWKRNYKGDFVKIIDGREVTFGVDDPATQQVLTANHNCYGSLVNASGDDCQKYIFNCLLDENPDSLEECLKNLNRSPNFYDVSKKEINSTHPLIAIRTLQRFGFRKHKVYDNKAGCQLYKVERVDNWLKNFMKNRFKDDEIQKIITGNTKLLAYLDLMAQFVNANPSILNKEYTGTTEEAVGVVPTPEFAKSLGIQPRKEPSKKSSGMYELNLFKKHFEQYATRNKQGPFQLTQSGHALTPFGVALTPDVNMVVPLRGGQRGGNLGSGSVEWVIRKLNNHNEPVVGAKLMAEIFKGLTKQLNARGKSIDKSDNDKLTDHINNLISSEEELLRTLLYIERYVEMLDAFKDYNSKTLKVDDVKKYIDKHASLKEKHISQEQYLLKIWEKLQKLISEEGGDENGDYESLVPLNGNGRRL